MSGTAPVRVRRTRWGPIVFLATLVLISLIGAPLHLRTNGLAPSELALFVVYYLGSSFAITVGYHRCFAHRSFEAHPLVQLVLLYFGAASFQQSAVKWASLHRYHHRFTDTERDPYNAKEGFLYSHVGWIVFWKQPIDYSNVPDLIAKPLVRHQHDHYRLWSFGAGLVVPLAIGALDGHLVGALIFAVGVRTLLVLNSSFLINSFAHAFGSREFDEGTTARDHWLGALLTHGEGYHNYHHRFPGDYRNGARWYHWDPSKWVIWSLARVGLATNLQRSPRREATVVPE